MHMSREGRELGMYNSDVEGQLTVFVLEQLTLFVLEWLTLFILELLTLFVLIADHFQALSSEQVSGSQIYSSRSLVPRHV